MMQGISVGTGELADKICRLIFKKGLIIETSGPYDEVIKILAPLTISLDLLEQGLDIIQEAVVEVMGNSRPADMDPLRQKANNFSKSATASLPFVQIASMTKTREKNCDYDLLNH